MDKQIDSEPLMLQEGSAAMPLLIAGPCSAETEEQTVNTAIQLASCGVKIFRAGIWKPRTRPGAFEGVGSAGFPWLKRVKKETGMLTAVEVATSYHVYESIKYGVDILWIGARTTANPFAVQEIADALKGVDIPVFVKNPINPEIDLWIGALERLNGAGVKRLAAIHRGFSSAGKKSYRNMPMWSIPLEFKTRFPDIPLVNDPSHIGGKREMLFDISLKAMLMGFDGLFIESHHNPDQALSDKDQQITPGDLNVLLSRIERILSNSECEEISAADSIDELRLQIDSFDQELMGTLIERMRVSEMIGRCKQNGKMDVFQSGRWGELLDSRLAQGRHMGLREEFVKSIFNFIHEESVTIQTCNGN